jgi:hypothetical protein
MPAFTGVLITRDLLLVNNDALKSFGSGPVGFGSFASNLYLVDAIVEQGAGPHDLAILRLGDSPVVGPIGSEGPPGNVWGVARLSALYVPQGQPIALFGHEETEWIKTRTRQYLPDGRSFVEHASPLFGAGIVQVSTGAVIAILANEFDSPELGCPEDAFDAPLAKTYQNSPILRNLTLDAAKVSTVL